MRTEFARLLKQVKKNIPGANLDLVRHAYRVANEAHTGQTRLSGEPYVMHCIQVAQILSQLHLDTTTIAAGLLHDVLEDTSLTRKEIDQEFGSDIASIVEGMTKIGALSLSTSATTQEEKQAANLRKMLVAVAADVRVLLVKLADRLHNMRTIKYLPEDKIKRISRETLDIYAPLAHRLGIARWKWELEDHAFHFLRPDIYKDIASRVEMKRREREAWLAETCEFLIKKLADSEVYADVIGRPKHLYSIYTKMIAHGKDFDQVMDVLALRVITQSVGDCYNALGVVHQLWPPVPGRFKDYIAMPKANLYQSIHTTVMCQNGRPLEIQIRTAEMDHIAREGVSAHWLYKEGANKPDPKLESQLKWLRQMYEWIQDAPSTAEIVDNVKRDFGDTDVYVFTPKGEVKELPVGATPLDFAYLVHSEVGHHCIGARVNSRMVPLRYNLQTGDMVEILTSKTQTPHLGWLDIVVTPKARGRIRQRLREIGELEPLDGQIRRHVIDVHQEVRPRVRHDLDDATKEKMIRLEGRSGMAVNFAKCCTPCPGQPVIGYITKGSGITIHRADCRGLTIIKRDPDRLIEAYWAGYGAIEASMKIVVVQRPNILADITNAIRPMNVSILRGEYAQGDDGRGAFEFTFEAPDRDCLERVQRTLRTVAGVRDVTILSSAKRSLPKSHPVSS